MKKWKLDRKIEVEHSPKNIHIDCILLVLLRQDKEGSFAVKRVFYRFRLSSGHIRVYRLSKRISSSK